MKETLEKLKQWGYWGPPLFREFEWRQRRPTNCQLISEQLEKESTKNRKKYAMPLYYLISSEFFFRFEH